MLTGSGVTVALPAVASPRVCRSGLQTAALLGETDQGPHETCTDINPGTKSGLALCNSIKHINT